MKFRLLSPFVFKCARAVSGKKNEKIKTNVHKSRCAAARRHLGERLGSMSWITKFSMAQIAENRVAAIKSICFLFLLERTRH